MALIKKIRQLQNTNKKREKTTTAKKNDKFIKFWKLDGDWEKGFKWVQEEKDLKKQTKESYDNQIKLMERRGEIV